MQHAHVKVPKIRLASCSRSHAEGICNSEDICNYSKDSPCRARVQVRIELALEFCRTMGFATTYCSSMRAGEGGERGGGHR